jgi:uncharacterized protein (UPF0333 family)
MRENHGQITIEAILIFGLFILIFIGVSVPLAFKARDMASDTGIVADARYASEEIVSTANSISVPEEKRTVQVYIPGFTSAGVSQNGKPLANITTSVSTNGTHLLVVVSITRYREDGSLKQRENHNITKKLYGTGWSMSSISENRGRWYSFVIYWRNITWS